MDNSKRVVWLGMMVGSTIGGYLPLIWGGSAFSFSSIFLATVGAIGGIYLGYKISH